MKIFLAIPDRPGDSPTVAKKRNLTQLLKSSQTVITNEKEEHHPKDVRRQVSEAQVIIVVLPIDMTVALLVGYGLGCGKEILVYDSDDNSPSYKDLKPISDTVLALVQTERELLLALRMLERKPASREDDEDGPGWT